MIRQYDVGVVIKALRADGWGVVWQANPSEYHMEKGVGWLIVADDQPFTLRAVRRICQATGWTPEEFEARYCEMSSDVQ